jgi:type IV pilus assembly protein PilA
MELLIVVAILLIIASIAIPKYNDARMSAQEMATVQTMKTIQTVQVQYYSQFGRFATSLSELGPAQGGKQSAAASDLISSDLATGEKSGYRYTLTGTPSGYTLNATPVAFGSTGRRTFYTDQNGVVRQHWGAEPATAASEELGSVSK